jgi:cytochrome c
VHPSFDLSQARPNDFEPKVAGMDFKKDGSLIISTWDAGGSVWKITNAQSGDPSKMKVKKIAFGLAEPLGLKVVDDTIYVMQKQEITKLVDVNNDDIIDEYLTLSDDWGVSSNFHEFGFGLEYKDGYFYATLATAIQAGGASTNPQIKDRGKVIKVDRKTGQLEFIASGLRTPNGIGFGYNGELFVADNQGDWLPSSKIVHVTKNSWFGSRSVDFDGTAKLKEKLPMVWLPQDEIGNSPSTPSYINVGPYKGQMIHGEVTHGGIKRVFVEEINGVLQGCVFRFTQGLEGGVNRIIWGPDGSLYIGMIGNPGNWGHANRKWFGLQKLTYNKKSTFEMLAVRSKSNGLEIEFTEPLAENQGLNPSNYEIKQWLYKPTADYGGPKLNEQALKVKSVSKSQDNKKVFLEIDGMKSERVLYIHLIDGILSSLGNSIWSTEAWYTMNNVSKEKGQVSSIKEAYADNTLSESEKNNGWKLLFDGKKIDQFRNFKKQTIGSSWVINDNAIHLNCIKENDKWKAVDGGDIITKEVFEDFELSLEWKIINCGNSGIMFNVVEDDKYDYVWRTGPEMQVLDNTCHPDTRYIKHRAGDLYDLIASTYPSQKPAGQWNKVFIRSKKGKVDFY